MTAWHLVVKNDETKVYVYLTERAARLAYAAMQSRGADCTVREQISKGDLVLSPVRPGAVGTIMELWTSTDTARICWHTDGQIDDIDMNLVALAGEKK